MNAVNLWKAQKLQSHTPFTKAYCQWLFVSIAENNPYAARLILDLSILFSITNMFSASFSSLLHRALLRNQEGIWNHKTRQSSLQIENRKRRPKSGLRS
jgi:hypothetical protein